MAHGSAQRMEIGIIRYLPDTNILIYALSGKQLYAEFITSAIIEETLAISVIVAAEFLSGAAETEAAAFERLIAEFDTLPVTTAVAYIAASYRKTYAARGLRLPDALIAASCRVHDAALVTNNLRDFPMRDITKLTSSDLT